MPCWYSYGDNPLLHITKSLTTQILIPYWSQSHSFNLKCSTKLPLLNVALSKLSKNVWSAALLRLSPIYSNCQYTCKILMHYIQIQLWLACLLSPTWWVCQFNTGFNKMCYAQWWHAADFLCGREKPMEFWKFIWDLQHKKGCRLNQLLYMKPVHLGTITKPMSHKCSTKF